MDLLHTHCAGLDVHKKSVVAAIRIHGPKESRHAQTRTFGTTTGELTYRLRPALSDGFTNRADGLSVKIITY